MHGLDYLITCLRPGGHLVITTRGHQFIDGLKRRHSEGIVDDLTKNLPNPEEVSARYAKGEFQFYPTGTPDCVLTEFSIFGISSPSLLDNEP